LFLTLSFLDIRIDNTINGDNLEKPYKLNDNTSVTSFIDIFPKLTINLNNIIRKDIPIKPNINTNRE